MSNAAAVKRNLDRLRSDREWSLARVAEESGVPLSTLKDVSRQRYGRVDLGTVVRLAGAFDCTIDEMLAVGADDAA